MFKKAALVLILTFASNLAFGAPITFKSAPKKVPVTVAPAQTNCDKFFGYIKGYLIKDKLPSTDADALKYAVSSNTLFHDAWTKDPELGVYEALYNALTSAQKQGLSAEIKDEMCKQINAIMDGYSDGDIKTTAWFMLFEYSLKEAFFEENIARAFNWRNSPLNPAAMQDMIGSMLPAVQGKKLGSQDMMELAKKGGGGGMGGLGNQYNAGWLDSLASCVSSAKSDSGAIGAMGGQGIGGDPMAYGKGPAPIDKVPEKQMEEGIPEREGALHADYNISLCMAMSPIAAGGVGEGTSEKLPPMSAEEWIVQTVTEYVDSQNATHIDTVTTQGYISPHGGVITVITVITVTTVTTASSKVTNSKGKTTITNDDPIYKFEDAKNAKEAIDKLSGNYYQELAKAKVLKNQGQVDEVKYKKGSGVLTPSPESNDVSSCQQRALSVMLGCIGTWGGNPNLTASDCMGSATTTKSSGSGESDGGHAALFVGGKTSAKQQACWCKGMLYKTGPQAQPTDESVINACHALGAPPANYKDYLIDPSPEMMKDLMQIYNQPANMKDEPGSKPGN